MSKNLKVPPEFSELAGQIGNFIEYWGFKNVHGRIWTHLYLAAEPLDASDLIERLQISKALVSMSLSELLNYDVVQIFGKSPRGTITYRANPNVVDVILNVLRKRERQMLSRIEAAHRLLRALPHDEQFVAVDGQQAEALGDLVDTASQALDGILRLSTVEFQILKRFRKALSKDPSLEQKIP